MIYFHNIMILTFVFVNFLKLTRKWFELKIRKTLSSQNMRKSALSIKNGPEALK